MSKTKCPLCKPFYASLNYGFRQLIGLTLTISDVLLSFKYVDDFAYLLHKVVLPENFGPLARTQPKVIILSLSFFNNSIFCINRLLPCHFFGCSIFKIQSNSVF